MHAHILASLTDGWCVCSILNLLVICTENSITKFPVVHACILEQGKGGGAPWWLQDLGSFHVSTDLDTVHLLLYLSVSVSVCICQVCTHLHTTNICLARGRSWTVCQVAPLDVCQVSPPVRVSVLESVVEGKRIGGKDLGVFVSSLSRPSVSLS